MVAVMLICKHVGLCTFVRVILLKLTSLQPFECLCESAG